MDTGDIIKKKVLEGQVLDDQGAWVPLVERRGMEKKILDGLFAGKVLSKGQWVSIPQARETAIKESLAPPGETRGPGQRRVPKSL
jgi:hypothetical protein